jgi:phosphoserine aminotransferase
MLALPVLERVQRELLCYGDTGASVMEMSHRSKMYLEIFQESIALLRKLMRIPQHYKVLMLQGGATQQFSAVPLNLLTGSGAADYVDSGNFAHLAIAEAQRYGKVHVPASSRADGYRSVPDLADAPFDPNADYIHITTNNTIYGTRCVTLPAAGKAPLIADMSSNILSEPYDVRRFGAFYAGSQKNIGPAGLCVLVVREDLLGRAHPLCPKLLNWQVQAEADSMYNTPNTFAIYVAKLMFQWLLDQGGVEGIEKVNLAKAGLLYDYLDNSALFRGTAAAACRSRMNVTFVTGDAGKDEAFCKQAARAGLINLKGHRNVGGMRASLYNAMPIEGVRALVDFMKQFELKNK